MILYADVLFIIDFSMDVLTLWAAGRLTHSKLSPVRIAASASFGALVSVASTVLGAGRMTGGLISALTAFVMSVISFGKGKLALILRRYIFLWLGGVLLGGIMTALMSAGSLDSFNAPSSEAVVLPIGTLLLFVLVSALLHTPKTGLADVALAFNGKSVKVKGLCDTGNRLADPFSGEPVILIDIKTAEALFSAAELSYLTSEKHEGAESLSSVVRLVPSSSLGGNTLVKAVRIHKVILNGKNCAALVAVTESIRNGSYSAVVPTKLL